MVNLNEVWFVGVDGCPLGWFSVGFTQGGQWVHHACATFQEVLNRYPNAELILVDIPIGLPDGPQERRCDKQARALLNQNGHGPGARVFRTPTRAALNHWINYPGDKQGARNVQIQITGGALSEQTLAIMSKIAEVDAIVSPLNSPCRGLVREVHPEICFWALNQEQPIIPNKRTPQGRLARCGVLQNIEPQTPAIVNNAMRRYLRKDVAKDDILDALAAAVTARNGWPNQIQTLPGPPQANQQNLPIQDPHTGLPMEMVYWVPQVPAADGA